MFDAVLFDLDGTLIQFSLSYADFMRDIAARWGITKSSDMFFDHYSRAILSEGYVTFQTSIERAFMRSGRPVPSDIHEACQSAVESYAQGIEVLPDAFELMAMFKGLPKAIVSNGPSDMQRAALAKSGLGKFFDQILISGDADVAVRKPNPKIFLLACERLGVSPERCLMIGDNYEADVLGAQSAGLAARQV